LLEAHRRRRRFTAAAAQLSHNAALRFFVKPHTMAIECSDIIKIVVAVFLPPLAVYLEKRACDKDVAINILLTLLICAPFVVRRRGVALCVVLCVFFGASLFCCEGSFE
jgi:uncharacterized membrane protein YqaE (UPF0057 family)